MVEMLSKKDKQYYLNRLGALDLERSSFVSHWKELSENIEPRSGNFFVQDRNSGTKRHGKIINSRGTQAHRNAISGMFAGTVSPTKRWFKLETLNQKLMGSTAVKQYLYDVENLLYSIFLDSNFYSAAPITLGEAILFGTGAMVQLDDFNSVTTFKPHAVGSYYISTNSKNEVDTFVEKRDWTVKQMVDEFGIENVSPTVKNAYELNQYDTWYQVCQFIDPNPDFNPSKTDESKYMKYRSAWFELGGMSANVGRSTQSNSVFTDEKFLRKSGFQEFPVHVFRWSVTGSDIYGTNCPGMVALGDVKMLQIQEKRKAQAIDKMVNPPLKGPPTLIDVPISSLPGGVTIYDQDTNKEGLSPLYLVDPKVRDLAEDILKTERRINEAFFVDLFLAISNMEGIQPKNQLELSKRNAERLLMLGPPLERLQQEFLNNIVERTFQQALRAGILPEPPEELSGAALNINFVSALAQAQRANDVGSIERIAGFVQMLSQFKPTILDKYDADDALEKYSQFVGGVPSNIVSQDEAEAVRTQRAEQQQKMMQAQAGEMQTKSAGHMAGAVKDMADAEHAGEE